VRLCWTTPMITRCLYLSPSLTFPCALTV
jgi:hypothetical protein